MEEFYLEERLARLQDARKQLEEELPQFFKGADHPLSYGWRRLRNHVHRQQLYSRAPVPAPVPALVPATMELELEKAIRISTEEDRRQQVAAAAAGGIVTKQTLHAFYKAHNPKGLAGGSVDVDWLLTSKTASQIVDVCLHKYGSVPEVISNAERMHNHARSLALTKQEASSRCLWRRRR